MHNLLSPRGRHFTRGRCIRYARGAYYANVVTVNVVTAQAAMLLNIRMRSSETFIHIGPKLIQFRSQIDPNVFKKHSEKHFCYDHPRYDHIRVVWNRFWGAGGWEPKGGGGRPPGTEERSAVGYLYVILERSKRGCNKRGCKSKNAETCKIGRI